MPRQISNLAKELAMSDRGQHLLILTGRRRRRHYLILVKRREVWLNRRQFADLCRLVRARGSDLEYVRLAPVTVRRLRAAIDEQLGEGAGMSIVETGDGAEYRLTFAPSTIARDKSLASTRGLAEIAGLESLHEIHLTSI